MGEYVTLKDSKAAYLAAMSPAERAEYDKAYVEAGKRMHLAQMVYHARTQSGLTQTALAERIGTKQATISSIERGAQAPGGLMLESIAEALGMTLVMEPAN